MTLKFARAALRTAILATSLVAATVPALAANPTLLRMNMVISNQDRTFPLWQEFAKELENKSNGTLKVEIYPSEGLGKAVDMIEGISRGAPVLQDGDPSHLANHVPDFSIFMAPYLLKHPDDIEKVWNSPVVAEWEKQLQEKGLRVVTLVYFGARHLLSNKQVHTRADTQGMKLRNAPTKMWNEVSRVLGGNPTNTAWSEAYSALEQRVADGAEAPLALLYSSKLFETRPYISLTGHLVATTAIIMSQKVYDNLPEDARKAIDSVGRGEPSKRAPKILAIEEEFRKVLEEHGKVFNEVNRDTFLEAASETPRHFPEWSEGAYDQVRALVEK